MCFILKVIGEYTNKGHVKLPYRATLKANKSRQRFKLYIFTQFFSLNSGFAELGTVVWHKIALTNEPVWKMIIWSRTMKITRIIGAVTATLQWRSI